MRTITNLVRRSVVYGAHIWEQKKSEKIFKTVMKIVKSYKRDPAISIVTVYEEGERYIITAT